MAVQLSDPAVRGRDQASRPAGSLHSEIGFSRSFLPAPSFPFLHSRDGGVCAQRGIEAVQGSLRLLRVWKGGEQGASPCRAWRAPRLEPVFRARSRRGRQQAVVAFAGAGLGAPRRRDTCPAPRRTFLHRADLPGLPPAAGCCGRLAPPSCPWSVPGRSRADAERGWGETSASGPTLRGEHVLLPSARAREAGVAHACLVRLRLGVFSAQASRKPGNAHAQGKFKEQRSGPLPRAAPAAGTHVPPEGRLTLFG